MLHSFYSINVKCCFYIICMREWIRKTARRIEKHTNGRALPIVSKNAHEGATKCVHACSALRRAYTLLNYPKIIYSLGPKSLLKKKDRFRYSWKTSLKLKIQKDKKYRPTHGLGLWVPWGVPLRWTGVWCSNGREEVLRFLHCGENPCWRLKIQQQWETE